MNGSTLLKTYRFVLFSSNSARYVAGRQDVLQYSHSKGYEQTKAPKLNKTKRKEKQIMEVLAEKKPIEEQVDCNIDINIFC